MPILGPIVFGQTWLVYASWAVVALTALYLTPDTAGAERSCRGGVTADRRRDGDQRLRVPLRARGRGRRARGRRRRLLQPGADAAVGRRLTGGAGWIAIALVIFAFWRPELCLVGAYFFGAFQALPFTLQARGVTIAPELFQALPYVMTVIVLVIVSSGIAKRRLGAPGALGVPFVREER